jgi:two-component system NtrC family sensor kinase
MRVSLYDVQSSRPLLNELSPGDDADYESIFSFGGRHYRLATTTTSLYQVGHRGWQSWALLVAGVLGTGLLGALLMLGTGETHRFERLLEARTRDLQASHERLKAEMVEREQAQAALYEAQRMKAIGQLTGGIAHDFNNLLMVVNGSVERLRRELAGEKAMRYLDLIHTATQRAENLTRQLLSFSQMRPLNPRTVDLVPLVRGMTEMLTQTLRGDIAIKVAVPDAVCPVNVDPTELELAILNLALNAQDAMQESGTLQIGVERALLAQPVGGLAGECIAIRVRDSGTGIPNEALSRVFEPFFTTKDVGKGSGLGLSQVYGFAKQSGGSATIESAVGRGTVVTLYLPISHERLAVVSTSSIAFPNVSGTRRGRVLVVEDDGDVARVLTGQLEELGHEVRSVSNADAALKALDEEAFDVMVSDILMPGGMSGVELARLVRVHRPQLAVLLITGYGGASEDPQREGFVVLRKPFDLAALSAALRNVARTRDRTASEPVATPA